MLYISDKAAHQVQEILVQNKNNGQVKEGEEQAVRVRVLGGGCSGLTYKLEFDHNIEETDQVFVDKGVKMVTDLKSFLFIANTTLDYSDGLNGKGFHFINPNAERTCSCGESFSV